MALREHVAARQRARLLKEEQLTPAALLIEGWALFKVRQKFSDELQSSGSRWVLANSQGFRSETCFCFIFFKPCCWIFISCPATYLNV